MSTSELEIKMMAKSAAADFLDKNIPLNDTLTKIAGEYDLNGHQIARLCEQANLNVYDSMFKKQGNGDFTFKVADQNDIVSGMKKEALNLLPEDYDMDPADLMSLLPKKEMEEAEKNTEKKAAFEQAIAKEEIISETRLRKALGRAQYKLAEIDSAVFEAEVESKEAVAKIAEMMRIAYMNGENSALVYAAAMTRCKDEDDVNTVKQAFREIGESLKKRGIDIFKQAKRISEDASGGKLVDSEVQPIKPLAEDFVVQGSHPILKYVDTVVNNSRLTRQAWETKPYIVKRVEAINDYLKRKTS